MNDFFKDFQNTGEKGRLVSSFLPPFLNKGNLDNFIERLHTFLLGNQNCCPIF